MSQAKIKDILLKSAAGKAWQKVGIKPHHGINVSLSSLRTKTSCGIGEFFDLVPLIKWCKEQGFDVIQLLPLNDSAADPSPYNSISSCALNPVYLSLSHLPFMKEDPELLSKLSDFDHLNASSRVLYSEAQSHKTNFLRHYLQKYEKKILSSKEYERFATQNSGWLEPYALFKSIKDKFAQANHVTWPKEIKTPSDEEYAQLIKEYAEDVCFYSVLQYLCFIQMTKVKAIANEYGVFLKGDIPILISPDSADVWYYCELFTLDFCAGAPPDIYNKEGQYWGFPLFNWPMMQKTNYAWWQQRLQYASNFYDIYRVDHVIGFFRIWAILVNRPAKEGRYVPAEETLWGPQGKEILTTLVSFSDMLPIAEDLGVVPPIVRPILQELGICSTKVMRWERFWKEDSSYIPIDEYPPISMTCISTHDSPTLAQWWIDFPEESMVFAEMKKWDYVQELSSEQREKILWDAHHTSSLFHINLLQEYLNLCPELSWPEIDQERINVPGKVLAANWTYRYKPTLEEIIENKSLQKALSKILSS